MQLDNVVFAADQVVAPELECSCSCCSVCLLQLLPSSNQNSWLGLFCFMPLYRKGYGR